jgi:hypothetical protein
LIGERTGEVCADERAEEGGNKDKPLGTGGEKVWPMKSEGIDYYWTHEQWEFYI